MAWLPKRIFWWLLITAAFTALAAGVTACSALPGGGGGGKVFDVAKAEVDVELESDASLVVTEKLRFRYTGEQFSGAYRDVPLVQSGATVSDVEVSDSKGERYVPGASTELGSSGEPGSFGWERMPEGLRIVWHYRQQGGERTFTLKYRVRGVVKLAEGQRADEAAAVVPWAIWGDQWQFRLAELDAQFFGAARPQWVELGRTDLGADVTYKRGAAQIHVDRVPAHTQIPVTVGFPRDSLVSTAAVTPGQMSVRDARYGAKAEAKELSSPRLQIGSLLATWQLPIVLGIFFALLWMLASMLRLAKEPAVSVPEYLPGPPDDAPPAIGYALAKEGGYSDRIVLATLLDLVDRGFYFARPDDGPDGLDLVLSIAIGRSQQAVDALLPFERSTLDFFDELLETPGRLDELKDRVPKHDEAWRTRWQTMQAQLEEAETGQITWDREYDRKRWLLFAGTLVAFAMLLWLIGGRTGVVFVPVVGAVASLLMLALVPSRELKRRDQASAQRGLEWAAFERWTKDFPRLHDDPPATLALWKRILVYGVAFGTADAVVKSGRIPESVFAEAGNSSWTGPLAQGTFYGSFGHSASFNSAFSSQVAAQSSSGSGGSSFSGGGGGGFSGGGGGGAW